MKNSYSNETMLVEEIWEVLNSPAYASQYLKALKSDRALTKFVPTLLDELARKMGLQHYRGKQSWDYYATDHVLYRDEDRVAEGALPFKTSMVEGVWLKRIRLAFEHENHLDTKGGYQEIAHLMLVNADLKVLMGYGDKGGDNYYAYARDYDCIYRSANPTDSETPILFIGEYKSPAMKLDVYLIAPSGLLQFDWEKKDWSSLKS